MEKKKRRMVLTAGDFQRPDEIAGALAFIARHGIVTEGNLETSLSEFRTALRTKHLRHSQSALRASTNPTPTTATTWEITASGTYILDHDIVFDGSSAPTPTAILILASDVVLDLNGHSITCVFPGLAPGAVKPLVFGIIVLLSERTRIVNGCIHGFSAGGILVALSRFIRLECLRICHTSYNDPVSNLINVAALSCELAADLQIFDCVFADGHLVAGTLNGCYFLSCDRAIVKGCVSEDNFNEGGPINGFASFLCSDIHYDTCLSQRNGSGTGNALTAGAHTASGYLLNLSTACTLVSCEAHHIEGAIDDCHGFPIFICPSGIHLLSCKTSHIRSGFNETTNTGAKATGFEMDITSNSSVVDCEAWEVVARNPEDKQCAGFSSGRCDNVVFERCTSTCNSVVLDLAGATGLSYGFAWAPDPRPAFFGPAVQIRFLECVGCDNDVGLGLFEHHSGFANRCSFSNNRVYGVYNPAEPLVISCNPATECNPPIQAIIPNTSQNNLVFECLITGNGVANIADTTPPSANNLYVSNSFEDECSYLD